VKNVKSEKIFSIPFNGDFELLEEALSSGRVMEVYFSAWKKEEFICNHYGGSEKPTIRGSGDVKKLSSLCTRYGAGLNLLCNSPSLFFTDMKALFMAVGRIDALTAVTVSDSLALRSFCREFPDLDVQASVIMNLDNPSKIRQALEQGAGTVVLPGNMARDARLLKTVAALKKEYPRFRMKLIANSDCAADCMFLPAHYTLGLLRNFASAPDRINTSHRDRLCFRRFTPENFIKIPFIRPEDLSFYRSGGLIDSFKLIYRSSPSSMLRNVYCAYFSGKYKGNLFDIVSSKSEKYEDARYTGGRGTAFCDNSAFPSGFAKKVCSCRKNCVSCGYCGRVAESTECRPY